MPCTVVQSAEGSSAALAVEGSGQRVLICGVGAALNWQAMKLRLPRWEEVRRLPLTMMIASLLAALGIVQMSFLLGQSVYRTLTWTQQTGQVLIQQTQLAQDVQVLQEAVAKASDPEYMNALARCIGYVGKNEQVVVAQSAAAQAAPDAPAGNCNPVRLP